MKQAILFSILALLFSIFAFANHLAFTRVFHSVPIARSSRRLAQASLGHSTAPGSAEQVAHGDSTRLPLAKVFLAARNLCFRLTWPGLSPASERARLEARAVTLFSLLRLPPPIPPPIA